MTSIGDVWGAKEEPITVNVTNTGDSNPAVERFVADIMEEKARLLKRIDAFFINGQHELMSREMMLYVMDVGSNDLDLMIVGNIEDISLTVMRRAVYRLNRFENERKITLSVL